MLWGVHLLEAVGYLVFIVAFTAAYAGDDALSRVHPYAPHTLAGLGALVATCLVFAGRGAEFRWWIIPLFSALSLLAAGMFDTTLIQKPGRRK